MTSVQYDDDVIQQDNTRGPGWFLKVAYVVIALFCAYYLFTYWDWQSDYQTQQAEIQTQIQGK
jgi:hypothetical protein